MLLIIFTSCNQNKNQILSKYYAPSGKKIPPCICEYWYHNGIDMVPFQDSCNKYNLFDTLK